MDVIEWHIEEDVSNCLDDMGDITEYKHIPICNFEIAHKFG